MAANPGITAIMQESVAGQPRSGPSASPGAALVTVIIVNYNVRELLQQALRSVQRAAAGLQAEIFVVDNDSVDGSVDMLRREFPDVHVIENKQNVGFAAANNQAILASRGKYLLILNPDTIVQEDTLEALVGFMDEHPKAGAAGCKILNPDGSFARESRRAFPTPRVAFYRMTGLSRLFPRSKIFGRYNLSYLPIDETSEVDALSGSCMMVRRAALLGPWPAAPSPGGFQDAGAYHGGGLLDEDFFMYGEDLDWCYRIQRAGWKIYYTPATQIIHYKGASTRKSELRYVRLFHGAMLRFADKHLQDSYPRFFLWVLRLAVIFRGLAAAVGHALRRQLLLDFLLLAAAVSALGWFRSVSLVTGFPPVYYAVIAPGFAMLAVCTIGAIGGYRGRIARLGPVLVGVATAVVLLSAASFYFKQIAFSRAVVLACLPAGVLLLAAVRLLRRGKRHLRGRTLFVGHPGEASHLRQALHASGTPPYELVGYVAAKSELHAGDNGAMTRLGSLHQLRDIVKLHRISDVVFGASSLSNKTIFTLMQRLYGLPAQCRILAEGPLQIIGNSLRRSHTDGTLLEAEEAIGALRGSNWLFDSSVALLGAVLHPAIAATARLQGSSSFWQSLALRTRQWPAVLVGRRSIVGYRPKDNYMPPGEWRLREGVFAVTEALDRNRPVSPEEAEQAYWYYVRNQSAFLDWIIVLRAVRLMKHLHRRPLS